MSEQLKPCPFCGSEMLFIRKRANCARKEIHCKGCFCTVHFDSEKKLCSTWNNRAERFAKDDVVQKWINGEMIKTDSPLTEKMITDGMNRAYD